MINRFMEKSQQPVPEVGMGVTKTMWSDRKAYTVIEVINNRAIIVQEDTAKRIDKNGMSESQEYEYTPNPEGEKVKLTLRKNGRWVMVGDGKSGSGWCLGFRKAYHDYTF